MRYKKYPFYVVHKASGKVVAGAEYREDARDMANDMPMPASELSVLTHTGVVRKYGSVSWSVKPEREALRSAKARSNPRYKKYPFYVVHKASGKVVAGAEYREDARDMANDLPLPASEHSVLTHTGVVRKYGRVSWGYPPSVLTKGDPLALVYER